MRIRYPGRFLLAPRAGVADPPAWIWSRAVLKKFGGGGGGSSVTKFVSSDQAISQASLVTVAHGLSGKPHVVYLELVCQTAEANWSVGDVIAIESFDSNFSSGGFTSYADTTNINVRVANAASFPLLNKTTGSFAGGTYANWKLRVTGLFIP